MEKAALSVVEFLATVGIGRTTFYEEVAAGRIKVLKLGKRTLIRVEEVKRYLDAVEADQS